MTTNIERSVLVEDTENGPILVGPTGGVLVYDDHETACNVARRKVGEHGGIIYVAKLVISARFCNPRIN